MDSFTTNNKVATFWSTEEFYTIYIPYIFPSHLGHLLASFMAYFLFLRLFNNLFLGSLSLRTRLASGIQKSLSLNGSFLLFLVKFYVSAVLTGVRLNLIDVLLKLLGIYGAGASESIIQSLIRALNHILIAFGTLLSFSHCLTPIIFFNSANLSLAFLMVSSAVSLKGLSFRISYNLLKSSALKSAIKISFKTS